MYAGWHQRSPPAKSGVCLPPSRLDASTTTTTTHSLVISTPFTECFAYCIAYCRTSIMATRRSARLRSQSVEVSFKGHLECCLSSLVEELEAREIGEVPCVKDSKSGIELKTDGCFVCRILNLRLKQLTTTTTPTPTRATAKTTKNSLLSRNATNLATLLIQIQ